MPAVPEILNGCRKIRMIKIFRQRDPQHLGSSSGNADTTIKICIELNAVQHPCKQHIHTCIRSVFSKQSVHDDCCAVCDHQLLKIAPDHQFKSSDKCCIRKCMPAAKLLFELIKSCDRSLQDLRKIHHKQHILQKILLRRIFSAINIYHIGNDLQRIKGNSHRQQKGKPAQMQSCYKETSGRCKFQKKPALLPISNAATAFLCTFTSVSFF